MADDEHSRIVPFSRVEVLPPARLSATHTPLPFGIGFIARAQNWSERRQGESFAKLVAVKNELLRLAHEQYQIQYDLLEVRAQVHARLDNLQSLRQIEEGKIALELARIRKGVNQVGREDEIEELRKDVETAELQVRLAQTKKILDSIQTPPAASPPVKERSIADKLKQELDEIRTLDEAFAREQADMIARAGGEANLSPEVRERLKKLDLARRTIVADKYEELM